MRRKKTWRRKKSMKRRMLEIWDDVKDKCHELFEYVKELANRAIQEIKLLSIRQKILVVICILICVSGFKVIEGVYNYWYSQKVYESAQGMYASKEETLAEWGVTLPDVDFESLQEENDDIIAWIYIPKTNVNFPVLKGKTNKQYLYQSYKKKYLTAGSIYIDYRCRRSFSDKNTVIYGHNMHDGNMFGKLKKYSSQDYMTKHQYIYIMRANGNINRYQIFAFFNASIEGEVYNLPLQKDGSEDQFNALKYEINMNNTYTGYKAEEEDTNYITLSTCTQDSRNDVRVCVIAKLAGVIKNTDALK